MKSVFEGYIKEGLFQNYCREIDAQGSCKVGFWKPIEIPT